MPHGDHVEIKVVTPGETVTSTGVQVHPLTARETK
jgi:hypothetical protein